MFGAISIARIVQSASLNPVEAKFTSYEGEGVPATEDTICVSFESVSDGDVLFVGVEMSKQRAMELGILLNDDTIHPDLAIVEEGVDAGTSVQ